MFTNRRCVVVLDPSGGRGMFDIRQWPARLGGASLGIGALLGSIPWPVAGILLTLVAAYPFVDRLLNHRENMAAIDKTAGGSPLESAAAVVTALRAPPPAATGRQLTGAVRPERRGRARGRKPDRR
jgi:hypothetical protein